MQTHELIHMKMAGATSLLCSKLSKSFEIIASIPRMRPFQIDVYIDLVFFFVAKTIHKHLFVNRFTVQRVQSCDKSKPHQ